MSQQKERSSSSQEAAEQAVKRRRRVWDKYWTGIMIVVSIALAVLVILDLERVLRYLANWQSDAPDFVREFCVFLINTGLIHGLEPLLTVSLLALLTYLCYRRFTAFGMSIGLLSGVLFVGLFFVLEWLQNLKQAEAELSPLVAIAGAVVGSGFGGITYVLVNVTGSWRRQNRARSQHVRRRQAALARRLLHRRKAIQRLRDQEEQSSAPWDPEEPRAQALRQLEEEELKLLQEIHLQEICEQEDVSATEALGRIDYRRRLLHVLMAMGLSVGIACLGTLLGVDVFEQRGEKLLDNALSIFGLPFLIGLYPRVFEAFLKTVADRLVGEEDDDEEEVGLSDTLAPTLLGGRAEDTRGDEPSPPLDAVAEEPPTEGGESARS